MLSGTNGTPERLERVEGAWTLQLERLMYRSAWMLHPQRFEVRGEQAILQQLREIRGCEPLAREAERLFGTKSQGELVFVPRDGRWNIEVRTHAVARTVVAGAQPAASSDQLEHLNARVASLEDSIRALQKVVQDLAKATVQAAAAAKARASAPEPSQRGSAQLDASEVAELAAAMPGNLATATTHAGAQPPADAKRMLNLPSLEAISDLVRGIAGPDAALMPRTAVDWNKHERAYGCNILTADERTLGFVALDFECALRLAAALMMESDENLTAMLAQGELSAEMADAASEVCNTLMSAVNKTAGNPHIKSAKLAPLGKEHIDRIANARSREDYSFNRSGTLTLAAF